MRKRTLDESIQNLSWLLQGQSLGILLKRILIGGFFLAISGVSQTFDLKN